MSYDMAEHRRAVRDNLLHLVRVGGEGWDQYALQRAKDCEREDPALHEGLHAAVKDAIGRRELERKPKVKS